MSSAHRAALPLVAFTTLLLAAPADAGTIYVGTDGSGVYALASDQ